LLCGGGIAERRRIKELTGRDVYVREFEDIKKSDRVNSAGRASYVERNQWMIDNSNFAIFCLGVQKTNRKSGAWIAFDYCAQRSEVEVKRLSY
jgi:hypothetical protein